MAKVNREALRERIVSRLEDLLEEIDKPEIDRARQFDLLLDIETNARLLVLVQRGIEMEE